MSLLNGNITAHRFMAWGPVPSEAEIAEGLGDNQYRPFQDGSEEMRIGTADWRNLMIVPPEPDFVMIDTKHALFGLRVDTRKVPAAMLKAQVELKVANLVKEKDLAFIGKEARVSLQDEVKADLLRKVLPTPKMVDVVWDTKGGHVWTVGATSSLKGEIAKVFGKAFGIELRPYGIPDWMSAAGSQLAQQLDSLDPLQIGEEPGCPGGKGRFLAEEFLLWLWREGLVNGGASGVKDDLSACFVDENLLLVHDRHAVKEQNLRKGNPAESEEAFEALKRGMRPSKLRMRLLEGEMEWTGMLSADGLNFTGLKLPPSSSTNPQGRAADRIFLLEEVFGHLERRFQVFLKARESDPKGLEAQLAAWVKEALPNFEQDFLEDEDLTETRDFAREHGLEHPEHASAGD